MIRTGLKAAATGVLVAGLGFATATQASAAPVAPDGSWDHIWTTSDANHGGTVYVEEHGDVITLCDTAADGVSATAAVTYDQGNDNYKVAYQMNVGGNGTCTTHRATQGGVYDLPENTEIYIYIYIGADGTGGTGHYYLNDH